MMKIFGIEFKLLPLVLLLLSGCEDNPDNNFENLDWSIDTDYLRWDITGEKGTILLEDAENGNSWNILGQAVNGTAAGEELTAARAYIAYWFAVAAFFPEVEIYK